MIDEIRKAFEEKYEWLNLTIGDDNEYHYQKTYGKWLIFKAGAESRQPEIDKLKTMNKQLEGDNTKMIEALKFLRTYFIEDIEDHKTSREVIDDAIGGAGIGS